MKRKYLSTAMTAFMLSLASLTLPPVGDLHAAEIFTRVTAGPGSSVGNNLGAAWGDYDNDGFIDLFVATFASGGHLLYHNNTNGTFSRVTNGPVAAVMSDGRGAAWGDYDNDGYLDLFLGNDEQPNNLFRNNGAGSFAAVNASFVSDSVGVPGVTWVDYDNDGYLDLFRSALFNPLQRLHRNNHDGTFTQITQGAFLTAPGTYVSAAWGDHNNDGRPDLFLPNVEGPNYLYRNDGGGKFTRVGAGMLNGNSNSSFAAWGDYDNDGDLDLFVNCAAAQGSESRTNLFYRNDGNDTFTRLTSLPANDLENQGGASMGCNWGDYDNDGWLDLFVANRSGQNDFLYHNNGDGTFTKITNSIAVKDAAATWAVAWGDYDNDGFLDLFVGAFTGTNLLYHNNGNDNHWLEVRLIGTRSNRAAIGAKVRVRATINGQTFWQMREVSGGDGTMGQNSLHVHAGLGNATNADLVRIEWPSGIVQELRDVAANQMLAIQESVADILPAQADVSLGATLTLSVTNAPPDSTLQWRLNGVDIAGATNATLEFSSATTNLNGRYTLVLSNATGLIFPRPAVVRVFDRPIITSQPQSTNAPAGSNVTLRVTAFSPSPITYQWQFNGTNIVGATNTSLAIINPQLDPHTGYYRVLVSDTVSNMLSDTATLIVLVRPTITSPPVAQTVLQGGTAVFSVSATPDHPLLPLKYRWLRQSVTILSNAPPTLVLTNVQPGLAGSFRVTVTNLAGSVSSAAVNLTVLPDFDRDGMADAWEKLYGFDTNNVADAVLDFDGDVMSNRDEYNAGTNPTNAASVLKLQLVTAGGEYALTFLAISNRTYSVEWNPDASGGMWNRLQDVLAQPSDRIESVSDTNANGAMRLYRVVTPKRP